jgi:glycosyltransferase involved in cell wall biosynthesis
MKTQVLLIAPTKSRFILTDFRHLRQVFDVEFYQPRLFLRLKKGFSPLRFLNLFFKVVKSNAVVCWFAGVDSLFACLFARVALKRSIIIVGGVDAAYEPTISYGHFVEWTSRLVDTLAYKLANVVAPVDASLAIKLIAYLPFCIEKKLAVLPTGYDPKEWYPSGKKKNLVLTVASVDWKTFYLKGLQTFIEAARHLPDASFVIVGKHTGSCAHDLEPTLPSNVTLAGYMEYSELLATYQRAKVYCQLSKSEGLPNSLCEAMLCECYPVGTRAGGIPSAIGGAGAYVRYGSVSDVITAIRCGLKLGRAKAARKRIIKYFPSKTRKINLVRLIINRHINSPFKSQAYPKVQKKA